MDEHLTLLAQSDTETPQRARARRRQGQRLTASQRVEAQRRFLSAYALSANVLASCSAAGVERATYYRWLEHDEPFLLARNQAEQEANDRIRAAIQQRAITGIERPLVHAGRVVCDDQGHIITVREYSDALLMFLAEARMPEFRRRRQVEVTGADGGPIEVQDARTRLATQLAALALAAAGPDPAGQPE